MTGGQLKDSAHEMRYLSTAGRVKKTQNETPRPRPVISVLFLGS